MHVEIQVFNVYICEISSKATGLLIHGNNFLVAISGQGFGTHLQHLQWNGGKPQNLPAYLGKQSH